MYVQLDQQFMLDSHMHQATTALRELFTTPRYGYAITTIT